MVDGWQWDPTLFRGSAAYYERGRLPYAPGFADVLADALGLDGRGRLLDVGCGPGLLTRSLAPLFTEAVGVDPDAGMLAEAARLGIGNARWVAARAEDLPMGLGEFRVVTFGNSFHWTDRDRVAATVFGMLEPGGAFVNVSDHKGRPPESGPLPPYDRIEKLVQDYLGPVRRAGQGVIANGTPDREDVVLARAGFVDFRRHIVPAGEVRTRTADDIVAFVFSLSWSAPHLFGDRLDDFERDLRSLLADAGGEFTERVPATEMMTWRKPQQLRL